MEYRYRHHGMMKNICPFSKTKKNYHVQYLIRNKPTGNIKIEKAYTIYLVVKKNNTAC